MALANCQNMTLSLTASIRENQFIIVDLTIILAYEYISAFASD